MVYPVPCVRTSLGLAAMILVAGCQPTPTGESSSGATGKAADRLAGYLREHGDAVGACFVPEPAMQGPGATQDVADPAKRASVAVNRLVIAIDASGSMAARAGDETKMDAAKRAATAFLASVPGGTQVGLVAFGHRGNNAASGKAESCRGVETLYPLAATDRAAVTVAMQRIRPTGWTPLAAAIRTAGAAFSPSTTPGAQVVYVVSDGLETCGGDPVAAARALNAGPVKAIVNIVGFDLQPSDRAQLAAVAAAGGGSFVEVRSGAQIDQAFEQLWHKARAVSAMSTEYFDAGGRITANNLASGKYTTTLNLCVAHGTTAESDGFAQTLAGVAPVERQAALDALRVRHDRLRARSDAVAAHVLTSANRANAAITTQQSSSEKRLGVDR